MVTNRNINAIIEEGIESSKAIQLSTYDLLNLILKTTAQTSNVNNSLKGDLPKGKKSQKGI